MIRVCCYRFACKVFVLFSFIFVCFLGFGFSCLAKGLPVCSAKNGAILIDSHTGDVFFEQDADKPAPVASTTKIVSTMVALEHCKNLDEKFEVDSKAIQVEGTSMGLRAGDLVTMRDLCYGMMLASGNDAANAAAVRIAGSVEKFVKLMNKKAKKLGCKNTVFTTPSGLDCEGKKPKGRFALTIYDILNMPHSTARDMAILTREAMKNETFKEICAARSYKFKFSRIPSVKQKKVKEKGESTKVEHTKTDRNYDIKKNNQKNVKQFDGKRVVSEHTIFNHNKLLGFFKPFCCGVKTGFTKNAGRCLVSAARKGGVELIAVVMNDADDWNDSKKLLNYGFSRFNEYELGGNFSKIRLKVLGESANEIGVELEGPTKTVLLNGESAKRVSFKVRASDYNFAPIFEGEKVGEVDYYVDGRNIATCNLVSKDEVLS